MKARPSAAIAVALGSGALLASSLTASPAEAATTTDLCTATYGNPNVIPLQLNAETAVTATSDGSGAVTLKASTDAKSILGYKQDISITWANLDTGKNGVESATKRVVGPDNEITLPDVATAPGRIALVVTVGNTGSLNPDAVTNGQCSGEITVD